MKSSYKLRLHWLLAAPGYLVDMGVGVVPGEIIPMASSPKKTSRRIRSRTTSRINSHFLVILWLSKHKGDWLLENYILWPGRTGKGKRKAGSSSSWDSVLPGTAGLERQRRGVGGASELYLRSSVPHPPTGRTTRKEPWAKSREPGEMNRDLSTGFR